MYLLVGDVDRNTFRRIYKLYLAFKSSESLLLKENKELQDQIAIMDLDLETKNGAILLLRQTNSSNQTILNSLQQKLLRVGNLSLEQQPEGDEIPIHIDQEAEMLQVPKSYNNLTNYH
jgi:hypothetical protein